MEDSSKMTFGSIFRRVLTVTLLIVVVALVVIAIWTNATIEEKIFLSLIGIIFALVLYILRLKEQNIKFKKQILKLENYIHKIKSK